MDELRISDADRAQALDLLSEQYAQGRLDKDEFDERSDAIWSAKTQGDLAPVFADLPWRSPEVPVRTSGRGRQWGPRWAPPLLPLIVVLVLLTVLTKIPFWLLLIGLWFVFGWRHRVRHQMHHRRSQLR